MFEVMRVFSPWVLVVDSFLLRFVVGVEGVSMWVHQLDCILKFWNLSDESHLDFSSNSPHAD